MTGQSSARLWFGVKCDAAVFIKALCARLKSHGRHIKCAPSPSKKRARELSLTTEDASPMDKKQKGDEGKEVVVMNGWMRMQKQREEMFQKGEYLEWATTAAPEYNHDNASIITQLVHEAVSASTTDDAVFAPFTFSQEEGRRLQIEFRELGGSIDSNEDAASDSGDSDEEGELKEWDEMVDRHASRELELDLSKTQVSAVHRAQLKDLLSLLDLTSILPATIGCYLETAVL